MYFIKSYLTIIIYFTLFYLRNIEILLLQNSNNSILYKKETNNPTQKIYNRLVQKISDNSNVTK